MTISLSSFYTPLSQLSISLPAVSLEKQEVKTRVHSNVQITLPCLPLSFQDLLSLPVVFETLAKVSCYG